MKQANATATTRAAANRILWLNLKFLVMKWAVHRGAGHRGRQFATGHDLWGNFSWSTSASEVLVLLFHCSPCWGRCSVIIGLRAFHTGKMVLPEYVDTIAPNINFRRTKPTKYRFR